MPELLLQNGKPVLYNNAPAYIEKGVIMVYCPMCEETHENSLECQRND